MSHKPVRNNGRKKDPNHIVMASGREKGNRGDRAGVRIEQQDPLIVRRGTLKRGGNEKTRKKRDTRVRKL